MLDWLVTGGASLLGGLFSSMSQKSRDRKNAEAARKANEANEARVIKMNADVRARAERAAAVPIVTNQQTAGSVDVAGMMAGAEAAGFNPLTWLRNGGMQAYAKTASSSQVYNSQLMDAALAGSTIFQESAPPLATAQGVGEVIGNALTTGASAWVNEASQERQNEFQMAMLHAQLEGANQAGNVGRRSGYVPAAFLGGSHNTANNSAILAGPGIFRDVNSPAGRFSDTTFKPESSYADIVGSSLAAIRDAQRSLGSVLPAHKVTIGDVGGAISDYLSGSLSKARPNAGTWFPKSGDLYKLPYGATY